MFSLCRKMSVLSEYICLPFSDILPKVLPSGFMAILGPRNLIMGKIQMKIICHHVSQILSITKHTQKGKHNRTEQIIVKTKQNTAENSNKTQNKTMK